jgi:hypothetical protein
VQKSRILSSTGALLFHQTARSITTIIPPRVRGALKVRTSSSIHEKRHAPSTSRHPALRVNRKWQRQQPPLPSRERRKMSTQLNLTYPTSQVIVCSLRPENLGYLIRALTQQSTFGPVAFFMSGRRTLLGCACAQGSKRQARRLLWFGLSINRIGVQYVLFAVYVQSRLPSLLISVSS